MTVLSGTAYLFVIARSEATRQSVFLPLHYSLLLITCESKRPQSMEL